MARVRLFLWLCRSSPARRGFRFERLRSLHQRPHIAIQESRQGLRGELALLPELDQARDRLWMTGHLPDDSGNADLPFIGENAVHAERQILTGDVTDCADGNRGNPVWWQLPAKLRNSPFRQHRPMYRVGASPPLWRPREPRCGTFPLLLLLDPRRTKSGVRCLVTIASPDLQGDLPKTRCARPTPDRRYIRAEGLLPIPTRCRRLANQIQREWLWMLALRLASGRHRSI